MEERKRHKYDVSFGKLKCIFVLMIYKLLHAGCVKHEKYYPWFLDFIISYTWLRIYHTWLDSVSSDNWHIPTQNLLINDNVLVSLLLTLNIFHIFFWCFGYFKQINARLICFISVVFQLRGWLLKLNIFKQKNVGEI